MVMCWAPGCNHYNQRETCKFFKFPNDPQLRKKWISLVRRDIEPGPGAFLCSCHFIDGKRENGPQLFKYNLKKIFQFSSPEKRKRRQVKQQTVENTSATTTTSRHMTEHEGELASTSKGGIAESIKQVLVTEDHPQASTSRQDSFFSAEVETIETVDTKELLEIENEPQPSTSSQNPAVFSAVLVEAENYFLEQQLLEKEKQLAYSENRMSFRHIENNESLILLYTGLPNALIFKSILELLKDIQINYYFNWKVEKLHREDQLLLTLMKLRHNFPQLDLAQRFNISQAAVSNIIITWVHVLHDVLFKKLMAKIPPRNKNRSCLPNCCSTFTNCRIIIDCTEIFTAVSRKYMAEQKVTYSSYKHRNTWKGLVGVAPNGVVTYISGLYPGSTSDKKIVQHCGILEQLSPGDLVLADKGFLIRDILPPGVALNLPPFLTTVQFTPEQVRQTESIARARIHVERAIRRMKVFRILQYIPQTLRPYAQEIFQLVGALTNLQYPLVREVEQYYIAENE